MKWIKKEIDTVLHMNMSMVGGFFGAYALLLRHGNFGSAQTSNLIYIIVGLMNGQGLEVLIRTGAFLLYVISIILACLLPHYIKRDFRWICIKMEIVGVVVLGFIPATVNDLLALYPLFVITAFQWGTYSGAKGYNSSSIFSTNNLKQTVISCVEYFRTKEPKQKEKCTFYGGTLLCYHIGVVYGAIAVYHWAERGIWGSLVLLVAAMYFLRTSALDNMIFKGRRRSDTDEVI